MLWLALEFPELALDVLADATASAQPLAICETEGSRRRVVACNAAAVPYGVRAGLPLAAAQALCARLCWVERRRADERAALIRRATWAMRFTPVVALFGQHTLLLELATSCRLFGGLRTLIERIRAELSREGGHFRAAAAPTPSAARLLARAEVSRIVRGPHRLAETLENIALEASELRSEVIDGLHGVGLRTLGEALRLPRAEFARRYGQDSVDYLDRIRGEAPDPLPRHMPPERFEAELSLPVPVHHTEALGFACRRLLRELCHWLEVRQLALQRYALVLQHEDHPPSTVEIGLREHGIAPEHFMSLLRARLERLQLPGAVERVRLEARECQPLAAAATDLFEPARRVDDDAGRLIEQLRSRLGEASVRQMRLMADHRPEFAQAVAESRPAMLPPLQLAERPLFLLDPPQALEQWPELYAQRVSLTADTLSCERIETGWWDEHKVRRDYYHAHTREGATYWVFRERGPSQRWFVHGIFA